jgi:hypothetical protein
MPRSGFTDFLVNVIAGVLAFALLAALAWATRHSTTSSSTVTANPISESSSQDHKGSPAPAIVPPPCASIRSRHSLAYGVPLLRAGLRLCISALRLYDYGNTLRSDDHAMGKPHCARLCQGRL